MRNTLRKALEGIKSQAEHEVLHGKRPDTNLWAWAAITARLALENTRPYADLEGYIEAVGNGQGCRCVPPGSGAEWCVGTCHLRDKILELEAHHG